MKKCGLIYNMNMKKIIVLLSITAVFLLQACEKKGPGDNYDFSNSLPPYVALSSTAAVSVKQGTAANISFLVKTAIQQQVTITYKVTGAINIPSATVVLNREAFTVAASIPTAGSIVAPATTATATLTLVSAVKADGTVLTIGSKNDPQNQKVVINVNL
ncbi:hypothetical protein SAMN04488101_102598 [Pedobacter nyackensis]|uniref:Calx-beta domain-containing protein n=2 Tax=Pedobacter nyackensis TaxID=475255 RepID=A0A1W2BLG4_9SPHI|nr:hypothetical protein SAMN04488101_102598 [Pedobacter nyackensis]